MVAFNSFEVIGNMGNEPVRKDTATVVLATFSVAETQFAKGQETTAWWKCVAFGKLAERILEQGYKGCQCFVRGHLTIDSFEKDDQSQERYEVVLDSWRLLSKKKEEEVPW